MARARIRGRPGRTLVAAQILGLVATAIGIAPIPALAAVEASAPNVPTNPSPTDGATGVSIDPTLQVGVGDADGGQVTTSFYGRPVAPVATEDFTIVEIPDTQHYVENVDRTATFNQQTQWIVDNEDDLNVVFVTHVGDITEHYDTAEIEFQRADSAMDTLDNAGIPNNIAPGNHDFSTPGAVTSNLFDAYFPPSRYDLPANPWYGGWLGEESGQVQRHNKDNYELFTAGGIDFLIIHLEVDMPTYAVQWANEIIDRYPDRQVIISTHAFLNLSSARGTSLITGRANGLSAAQVWTQLIAPNCNVFMVINGHYHGEGRLTSTNSCGQPVHQVLADYQARANGGDGWLRYYTFQPGSDTIRARTYSPKLGEFEVDDSSEFTLPYVMDPLADYQLIGSVATASGTTASVPWPGRAPNTGYAWYAVTSDGVDVVTSPTWTFTTGGPPPPPNQEPTFDQDLGNRTSPEAAVISLDAGATDPDGDNLTYAAANLPAGLSINTTTGLITGIIAYTAAPGPYAVSITVRDGPTIDATDTFSWTVTDVVVPPSATISLRSVSYGSNNSVVTSIAASRPAGVVAGDVLLASIDTRGSSVVTAPAGWTLVRMDMNASSLRKSTYVRVATGAEPASYTWTFSGSRLAAAVIHAYTGVDTTIPINAAGGQINAPGVSVTAPSITTTVPNTMLVGFFAKQSTGTWTPPAGMTERGEINGAGGSQTTSATGVDAVVAAIGPTGTRTAIASSAALNVGHLVALRPAALGPSPVNQEPTFDQDLGNRTDLENAVINLDGSATDGNGDQLTYAATSLPAGLTINTATGLISGTIAFTAAPGPYAVSVTVRDGATVDATDMFTWTITNVNREPTFDQNLGNRTDPEGGVINLDAGATDPDGDPLTYAATNLPPGLGISATSGLITGTIGATAAPGPYAVNITVRDGAAVDGTDTFTWTVTEVAPPNQEPTFDQNIGNRTDPEGTLVSLDAGATDPDGDSLTYAATNLPGGLAIDPNTGLISGTISASAAASSPYVVSITVRDGATVDATDVFSWTVTDVVAPNGEPTFDQNLGNRTDPENALISLDAGATDPDGDPLTYAATNLPAGLSINTGTGLISGTIAPSAAPGPYAVSITVRDGATVDATDSFNWTVTDVVVPPPAGISLRSVSYGSNNAVVTSIAAARPAGVVAGDVLLASIDTRGSSVVTAPAGWTLIRMDINESSLRKSTYVRVATAAEPVSYTWTFSGSRLAAAVIHAYSGVDTADPVNAVGGQVNARGTSVTAPSISTTVANTMLVGFFAKQSSGTWTPPTGMTERGEINGTGGSQTTSATGVDALQVAIGPTGTRTAIASGAALNVGHLVALRPAAGP